MAGAVAKCVCFMIVAAVFNFNHFAAAMYANGTFTGLFCILRHCYVGNSNGSSILIENGQATVDGKFIENIPMADWAAPNSESTGEVCLRGRCYNGTRALVLFGKVYVDSVRVDTIPYDRFIFDVLSSTGVQKVCIMGRCYNGSSILVILGEVFVDGMIVDNIPFAYYFDENLLIDIDKVCIMGKWRCYNGSSVVIESGRVTVDGVHVQTIVYYYKYNILTEEQKHEENYCNYTFDCEEAYTCENNKCKSTVNTKRHIPKQACYTSKYSNQNCPKGYSCLKNTCFEN